MEAAFCFRHLTSAISRERIQAELVKCNMLLV